MTHLFSNKRLIFSPIIFRFVIKLKALFSNVIWCVNESTYKLQPFEKCLKGVHTRVIQSIFWVVLVVIATMDEFIDLFSSNTPMKAKLGTFYPMNNCILLLSVNSSHFYICYIVNSSINTLTLQWPYKRL